jgi:hypothetical protein
VDIQHIQHNHPVPKGEKRPKTQRHTHKVGHIHFDGLNHLHEVEHTHGPDGMVQYHMLHGH